ncbi:hypothetical protein QYE76_005795 [Lolium multiflorum]|uniref:Carboxypeptidase n=1 Tax=Lolium multiflorum TaxID=4521 RepID=A0AAD8RUE9_LOLMU|nr:hypothetical protein QYE76_005795 [Lolium multiflorum]
MTMRTYTTCSAVVLALLLGAALANAAILQQRDVLKTFIEARARANGHVRPDTYAEEDTWADPDSSFKHLPTKCSTPPPGTREADKIAALPGQPPRVNFDQYSGYVTVSEQHGRALFYYFVESPYEAASKPLVLWLNGGPGCSSLGAGAFQELGPFRVNPDGKTLSRNRHAWNNVANILFLESPAGVGFSYSNTSSENYVSGDRRTAVDAYIFLLNWLERFPEYKGRDFFIAGESYSGHYVPQLASVIIALHKFGLTSMNLKGIFVGNPLLDDYKNDKGWLEFLWNHGVMSDEVWGDISAHCSFRGVEGKACGQAKDSFRTGDIDPYNIYAPVCLVSRNGTLYSSSYLAGYDPCIGAHVSVYFNKPEVQKAIHVRTKTEWSECADLLWIYSGDMDDVCPITATRYSVKDLGLAITKPWRPWYTPQSEVGGYAQQYEGGFTFASVRGAGHLVPSFQPKRSLVLFYSFLKGVLPPAFPKVSE